MGMWSREICIGPTGHTRLYITLNVQYTGILVTLNVKYTGILVISLWDLNRARDYFALLTYRATNLYLSFRQGRVHIGLHKGKWEI